MNIDELDRTLSDRLPYACPACGRRFERLAQKKAHVRTKHDKPAKAQR